jgi:hypothetical protein
MSNVLKASLQTTIYSLADRGWSQLLPINECHSLMTSYALPSIPCCKFNQKFAQSRQSIGQSKVSPLVVHWRAHRKSHPVTSLTLASGFHICRCG